jgi:CubicO group peptidase (beta-lactamase class C family)
MHRSLKRLKEGRASGILPCRLPAIERNTLSIALRTLRDARYGAVDWSSTLQRGGTMTKTLTTALSVASALAVFPCQAALAQVETQKLRLNDRIEREISAGETHEFRIDLRQGQFLFATVEQPNIDVVVRVRDPEGNLVRQFDDTGRTPENVTLFPQESGEYTIEIAPFSGDVEPGQYAIAIERLEPAAQTKPGQVDQLLSPWDRDDTPGAAIAIVQDGEVIYKRGYGIAQLEYAIPITPSTVFSIESDSKQFTAYAVAMLALQGKLSLDNDIRAYLPDLPDFGEPITIRHLIHHTSGLREQYTLLGLAGWRLDDVITNDQVLRLVKRQRELNFSPGDQQLYCNTGYTLLAEIVSVVTGQPFSEWTAQNIFQPLGMTSTHFHDNNELLVPNRAYGYVGEVGDFRKRVHTHGVGPSGVFTTVEDLAKWVRNLDDDQLGGPALNELIHTRGMLNNGDTLRYAFGLNIGQHRGLRTVAHGGGGGGFNSYFVRYPEQKFAVIILCNLGNFRSNSMAHRVAELFLSEKIQVERPRGDEPREERSDTAPQIEPWAPDAAELAEYVGEYASDELGTTYTISVRGSVLVATHIRHGPITLTPTPWAHDTFIGDTAFLRMVRFQRNDENEITGYRVSGGGVRNIAFARR